MELYYVTFGQRYRHDPHPLFPRAHPDGWVAIEAGSWERARDVAFGLFGQYWSFIYTEAEFDPSHFPRGELARVLAGQLPADVAKSLELTGLDEGEVTDNLVVTERGADADGEAP
jgi:hypothetical protein